MSLTYDKENNRILSNHIRNVSRSIVQNDAGTDLKQLAEIVHYAPLLKLKVIKNLITKFITKSNRSSARVHCQKAQLLILMLKVLKIHLEEQKMQ